MCKTSGITESVPLSSLHVTNSMRTLHIVPSTVNCARTGSSQARCILVGALYRIMINAIAGLHGKKLISEYCYSEYYVPSPSAPHNQPSALCTGALPQSMRVHD